MGVITSMMLGIAHCIESGTIALQVTYNYC